MEPIATWEKLLLGVLVKKMMKVSREAKSDWIGLIIPIAMVSLFVFVLIQII